MDSITAAGLLLVASSLAIGFLFQWDPSTRKPHEVIYVFGFVILATWFGVEVLDQFPKGNLIMILAAEFLGVVLLVLLGGVLRGVFPRENLVCA